MPAEMKKVVSMDIEEELDTEKGDFLREVEQLSHQNSQEEVRAAIFLIRKSIRQFASTGFKKCIIHPTKTVNACGINVSITFGDEVIEHFEAEGFSVEKNEDGTSTTISW